MKLTGRNIIGQKLSGKGRQFVTPVTAGEVPDQPNFKIATRSEVDAALKKAAEAFEKLQQFDAKARAKFLRTIAEAIEALGDNLIETAMAESGLPEGRIRGERGRTVGQLRLFADHIEEGSWVDAVIDHADPNRSPIPKADIRRMLVPVGPVVVFTASNFPLAFSTAGGDTASAFAAGCPVIVKGHEAHPATNELVSRAIQKAAKKTGMPDGIFSSLNGDYRTGAALVKHPLTASVAFTGSQRGGRALFDIAAKREHPIPVFAEMGSVNPITILPGALQQRGEQIANQIAGSVALGAGQFCTNPGLIFLPKKDNEIFVNTLCAAMEATAGQCMLNPRIFENYDRKRKTVSGKSGVKVAQSANGSAASVKPSAAVVPGSVFLENPDLQEEVFGPFTLLVTYENLDELNQLASVLDGQLTATIFGEKHELAHHRQLISQLQKIAGRLLLNGVPTGVEVGHAMQHGGPYPATTDGRFTSVGTAAIRRFARPVAYQNFPEELLPVALREGNPLGIWRLVDGNFQK